VLEADGVRIGWHRVRFDDDRAELEDLWVEPTFIRQGYGRILFEHAVDVARAGGAHRLEWDAEPFAAGFYTAMGGREFARSPSAVVPGRTLPRMRLLLAPVGKAAQGTRKR
jgi:GNAT superfamily N-acetyltransferase